jgi:5-methylcytosine-specific restriction endonuclease McrA
MPHKDHEKNKEYMREYMLKRYQERRKKAVDKLGGKCYTCSSQDGLQFDHVDPNNKSFTIAKMSSVSEEKFWQEVDKCQLLCQNCHEKKTLSDIGRVSAKETHGTLSSYKYCKCELCKQAKSDYMKKYSKSHVRKRDRQ